jgi:uncharacterized protein
MRWQTIMLMSVFVLLYQLVWGLDLGDTLFSDAVFVKDQSVQTRRQAVIQSWQRILIKVSGRQSIPALPEVQAAHTRADLMLQRFQYVAQGSDSEGFRLDLFFDPLMIKQFMREIHEPLWGAVRPSVLLWIVNPKVKNSVTEADQQVMLEQAERRGLPVIFPVLNEGDRASLEEEPLSVLDPLWIQQHFARYQADKIVIGAVQQQDIGWKIDWTDLSAEGPVQWSVTGDQLNPLWVQLVDHMADVIAAHDAVIPTESKDTAIDIRMTGIYSLQDYAALISSLNALPVVSNCQVQQLEGDRLILSLQVAGGGRALAHAVAHDAHFILNLEPPAEPVVALTYHWHRSSDVHHG